MSAAEPVVLEVDHASALALATAHAPLVTDIRLTSQVPRADVRVTLELTGHAEPVVRIVGRLDPGVTWSVGEVRFDVPGLASLRDVERATLHWRADGSSGELLAAGQGDLDLLPPDRWPGARVVPEVLAAFVLPNDPTVSEVLSAAHVSAGERRDPTEILDVTRALYAALQTLGLTLDPAPERFEEGGLSVRSPSQIVGERAATCLDVALLVAACLERVGLGALVVIARGRALAGVWLQGERPRAPWLTEPAYLGKLIDVGDAFAFDAATTLERPAVPLATAEARARACLDAPEDVVGVVDLRAARDSVAPLAFGRVDARPASPVPLSAERVLDARRREEGANGRAADQHPRVGKWLNLLLDLSLRNRLLAFRPSTRMCVPLESHDVAALEDALAGGAPLALGPGPEALAPDARTAHLAAELAAGRLLARLDAGALERRLIDVYRAARTAFEEGGVNTLYIAFGLLRWFESEGSDTERLAPILLWPVGLVRGTPWRILKTDEDPILNVTLVELLRRDYGLEMPSLERLPLDDAGTDVEAILTAVRKAVLPMRRWRVTDDAHLGLFSFSKFVMWQDLRAATHELLRNPVVRSLVLQQPMEEGAPFVRAEEVDAAVPPEALPLPLDADSSQVAAVAAAAHGRTFALQGPPGTGKSQTIANLIAATLAAGKTVLFVSEKMAALSVVHSRLCRIGLGDFCLELHSLKANKRDVAVELARCLEAPRGTETSAWEERSGEVLALRTRLNAYVAALHAPRPSGRSFFESAAELMALDAAAEVHLDLVAPASVERATVERWESSVTELVEATRSVGALDGHPFRHVGLSEWSAQGSLRIRREIAALEEATTQLTARAGACAQSLSLDEPGTTAELEELCGAAEDLSAPGAVPARALDLEAWPELDNRTRTYVERRRRSDGQRVTLSTRWTDALYDLDLAWLSSRFKRYAGAFFLWAWLMLRGARRILREVAVGSRLPAAGAISGDLGLAQAVARERPELDGERAALLDEGVPEAWLHGDVAALHGGLERATRLSRRLRHLLGARPVPEALRRYVTSETEPKTALAHLAEELRSALLRQLEAERTLCASLDVAAGAAWPGRTVPGHREGLLARLAEWGAEFGRLRAWCAYRRAAEAVEREGLGALTLAHEAEHVATRDLHAALRRGFLTEWCAAVEDGDPRLSAFSGAEHHRAVADFATRDAAHLLEARSEAHARLASRLPEAHGPTAPGSEIGKVLREAKKKRGVMPIRQLLQELPTLLPRLKPCLLMSPLSVAQYLPPGGRRFDLVVFDEASQICTHDAIGALSRGDRAVVVGDSRQLPPTAFFQRGTDGDEDDGERADEDVVELESILDEVVASGVPQLYLRWHYRSRHEDLIAFSNGSFYDGRLLTFPSPHTGRGELGVRWHPVAGVYDRGRSCTNRLEAEALVAHLVACLREPGARTYGVVTFSLRQQGLVEDLLDEARAAHPELEAHFGGDEPVFVKNLENVQGDERDVILLSVAYGPDRAGRVAMGFGPLSLDGGERRLNVAVTRARERLEVFSSLRESDIDLARTTRPGPRHLKAFLRYAEHGPEAAGIGGPGANPHSPFEADVKRALEAAGHKVHEAVGCGDYRVDLAVVDPERPGAYLVGIECDGRSYASAPSARDRDRLRREVLERLGWRLHRIWLSDWRYQREREVERLEARIQALVARHEEPEPWSDAPTTEPPPVVVIPVQEAPIPPYRPAVLEARDTEEFFLAESAPTLRRLVQAVVAEEGPVHVEEVHRRLAGAFRIVRVTGRVRSRLDEVVARLGDEGALRALDGFLWPSGTDPATWEGLRGPLEDGSPRRAEYVPLEEVANGAWRVLRRNLALPEAELAKSTATLFGISRLSGASEARMQAGIALLVARRPCRRQGDAVVLDT